MNIILFVVGMLCLVLGVDLLILAFKEGATLWLPFAGGFLLGISYGLVWIKPN